MRQRCNYCPDVCVGLYVADD